MCVYVYMCVSVCVCIYRGTITKGKDASVNAQVFSIPGRSSLAAANIDNSRPSGPRSYSHYAYAQLAHFRGAIIHDTRR